ncbi:MAG: hypothetical protein A4E71_01861 [Smithella sp. PtaU1.Bin162]|nr:MAG: hypothetical protein A4E71_01861 [Smithella sp. PtaU1.Bin162]
MNMNKKIERHETVDTWRKISWNITCFSVSELRILSKEKSMAVVKKMDSKNHQYRSNYSEIFGLNEFSDMRKSENYGACAVVDARLNCSNLFGKSRNSEPARMIKRCNAISASGRTKPAGCG